MFIVCLMYFFVTDVLYVSLQYFDAVGLGLLTCKNRLPYTVLAGT